MAKVLPSSAYSRKSRVVTSSPVGVKTSKLKAKDLDISLAPYLFKS